MDMPWEWYQAIRAGHRGGPGQEKSGSNESGLQQRMEQEGYQACLNEVAEAALGNHVTKA
jgi:hypothetical protein